MCWSIRKAEVPLRYPVVLFVGTQCDAARKGTWCTQMHCPPPSPPPPRPTATPQRGKPKVPTRQSTPFVSPFAPTHSCHPCMVLHGALSLIPAFGKVYQCILFIAVIGLQSVLKACMKCFLISGQAQCCMCSVVSLSHSGSTVIWLNVVHPFGSQSLCCRLMAMKHKCTILGAIHNTRPVSDTRGMVWAGTWLRLREGCGGDFSTSIRLCGLLMFKVM